MNILSEFQNVARNMVYAVGVTTLVGMAVGETDTGAKVGAAFGVMMTLDQWSRRSVKPQLPARANDIA